MKHKILGLLATALLLSSAVSAQNQSNFLEEWSGEIVGYDHQTRIVSLYNRSRQVTHKVWVQANTRILRDGQERVANSTDLLLGDLVKVHGLQLDDGRIVGAAVRYPEPVAAAPANRTALYPEAGSRLVTARPSIGANFAGELDPRSVRVFVDGKEVTQQTAVNSKSVSFSPPQDLAAGRHQVHLIAKDNWGDVNQVWAFETIATAKAPEPVAPLSVNMNSPANNSTVAKNFVITGTTRPGATVNLTLTPNTKLLVDLWACKVRPSGAPRPPTKTVASTST